MEFDYSLVTVRYYTFSGTLSEADRSTTAETHVHKLLQSKHLEFPSMEYQGICARTQWSSGL
jgi:hypothetical protein